MDDFYDTVLSIGQDLILKGVHPQVGLLAPLPQSSIYREYGRYVRFSLNVKHRVMLPSPDCLARYPEVVDLIVGHPQLFAPFYYYDHRDLGRKRAIMDHIAGAKAAV